MGRKGTSKIKRKQEKRISPAVSGNRAGSRSNSTVGQAISLPMLVTERSEAGGNRGGKGKTANGGAGKPKKR